MKTFILAWLFWLSSTKSINEAAWTRWTKDAFVLPPAPIAGDLTDQRDHQELLAKQEVRTGDQCLEIARMGHASFKGLFKRTGPLTPQEYTAVRGLLKPVGDLAFRLSNEFKDNYERTRPANDDVRLSTCPGVHETSPAYPSTHATVVNALTCVLVHIYPEKSAMLEAYAEHIGEMREIAGLHHPSDIRAGAELGQAICARLKKDQDFQRRLKALGID